MFALISGWHDWLNSQAHHGEVPFYVLFPALRKEDEMVDISVRTDPGRTGFRANENKGELKLGRTDRLRQVSDNSEH
ncbi:hypothetical protein DPMN_141723 [Dreissena polymorpha]|uniref:Uncharacterized protein n=1 Tax=Dreissena polymorpha TaxID=45954 RepID=A0A9D4GE32_DREPO|nr:hypothetical protein DPMN_141719 [Dreissena polymorpha]KAH3813268.1 hypothetical protein DPMN_141721 [Dreissena polymorpha]KAH3813270.1 hypothetical protein DPMN_141723 [Dreissena polymorpha]